MWEVLGDIPEIQPAPTFYLELRKKIARSNNHRLIPKLQQVFKLLPARVVMTALALVGLVIGAYAGNFLFGEGLISFNGPQPRSSQLGVTLTAVRTLDPMPPGTLANGYVRMASYPGSVRE